MNLVLCRTIRALLRLMVEELKKRKAAGVAVFYNNELYMSAPPQVEGALLLKIRESLPKKFRIERTRYLPWGSAKGLDHFVVEVHPLVGSRGKKFGLLAVAWENSPVDVSDLVSVAALKLEIFSLKDLEKSLKRELSRKIRLIQGFSSFIKSLTHEASEFLSALFVNFVTEAVSASRGTLYYFDPHPQKFYHTYTVALRKGKFYFGPPFDDIYEKAKGLEFSKDTLSEEILNVLQLPVIKKDFESPLGKILGLSEECFILQPLYEREELVALLELAGKNFSEDDLIVVSTISYMAMLAMERAQTFMWAITDSLTGLYNFRFLQMNLDNEISHALRQRTGLSLAMLDLDDLKKINDTYGHSIGNLALQHFSILLKEEFSGPHCSIYRYGGDEFVVVWVGRDSEKILKKKLEELLKLINEKPARFEKGELRPFFSAGVVSLRMPTLITSSALLEAADAALYRAKRKGKARVEVYSE